MGDMAETDPGGERLVAKRLPSDSRVWKEEDVVAALKREDPAAFALLLAKHGVMLYRVAAGIMGRLGEAEDVVQDALLTVFGKIHTFDERSALTTWLYRIVVNTALMRLRSKARAHEVSVELAGPPLTEEGHHAREVADWADSAEDRLLRREALSLMRKSIESLPATYRAVYVLAEIEGLSHQEISRLLEIPVATTKVRLHRARLFLREVLADYFEERKRRAP